MFGINALKERLGALGYEIKKNDEASLTFSFEKVCSSIKNDINRTSVPEELEHIAVDMAAGEFLLAKKTFEPDDLKSLDLSAAVKQIQTGDTNTVFATGEGTLTPEQRLDSIISYLLNYGKNEFSAFRRLRW